MGHGSATMAKLYTSVATGFTQCFPMSQGNQMAGTLKDFIRKFVRLTPPSVITHKTRLENRLNKSSGCMLLMTSNENLNNKIKTQLNARFKKSRNLPMLSRVVLALLPNIGFFVCSMFVSLSITLLHIHLTGKPLYSVLQKPDVSSLWKFCWFEPIYYLGKYNHHSYPSKSPKKTGCWFVLSSIRVMSLHTGFSQMIPIKSLINLPYALLSTPIHVWAICLHLVGRMGSLAKIFFDHSHQIRPFWTQHTHQIYCLFNSR